MRVFVCLAERRWGREERREKEGAAICCDVEQGMADNSGDDDDDNDDAAEAATGALIPTQLRDADAAAGGARQPRAPLLTAARILEFSKERRTREEGREKREKSDSSL